MLQKTMSILFAHPAQWRHILVFCVALLLAQNALAERRMALIIGNAAYQNEKPLKNPTSDARLLGAVFKDALKFDEVLVKENLTRLELGRALDDVANRVGRGDTVVVYYSGHGMQVGNTNYLIPVDAQIKEAGDIRREGVAVNDFVANIQASDPRLAVLVLDACRDNPYATRTKSTKKGLARPPLSLSGNLLVAYATQDGDTAEDGKGVNSPYAAALAKHIRRPDLRVLDIFDEVSDDVRREFPNQRPTRYGDLPAKVYLASLRPEPAAPVAAGPSAWQLELAFWDSVKGSNLKGDFEAYLRRYPNGAFADLARNRIAPPVAPVQVATLRPEPGPGRSR